MQLSELIESFEQFWPKNSALDWDRVGLSVGSHSTDVKRVLVAVDLTDAVIDEAIRGSYELILTHHPLLLRGLENVVEDELKGRLIARLIKANLSTFSAHTNADIQTDGATSEFAKSLKLGSLEPIEATLDGFGHGVIGSLPTPMSLREFSQLVASVLPTVSRKVVFAGDPDKTIVRVAHCSGAGDSLISKVLSSSADVYVTSDLRHHPTLDALETPRPNGQLALVDVSHWASESLWVNSALRRLSELQGIEAMASQISTDPWTEEV